MSEIKTLEIPKWGLSMEEGTIVKWLIEAGDSFSKGQDICEIETTKIVNVLEAPFSGTLRKILAKEGESLAVGSLIAVCADRQISDQEIEAYIQSLDHLAYEDNTITEENTVATHPSEQTLTDPSIAHSEQQKTAPETNTSSAAVFSQQDGYSIPEDLQGYQAATETLTTPHARKLAEKLNINLARIIGSGRGGRISIQDLQATIEKAGGQWPQLVHPAKPAKIKSTQDDSAVSATPIARRLAKQWGINLHDCRVSGSRGRVCKEDVEAVYDRDHQKPCTALASGTSIQPGKAQVTVMPMSAMRRAIATRLQTAKHNAPHFRLTVDLNVEALQALRQQVNSTMLQVKLSLNDLMIKAAAAALMKVPEVNVQYDEKNQQILQFDQADIAVAVAIEQGLITPIVKAANKKSLSEISANMHDLAARAKTGKLHPDEFEGGSFSISNLGMLGIKQFDAIINPPQAAIMALGTAEERVLVEKGEIVTRQIMTATLSCDHRVIDGAIGAKFLASFKQCVENPALILL